MHLKEAFCIAWSLACSAQAFSWGSRRDNAPEGLTDGNGRLKPSRLDSSLSNMYAIALDELHDLESEPFCHRNAARLLVNNCQLLDGNDESSIIVDSGRLARDFVDSYAASLAICDLERGSFPIPFTCSKFQESTLARMPTPVKPELHVSTLEIDRCLEGLAQSDSAWSTWVSYRHKALRFCNTARAEHERDQTVLLYQRVTKIIQRLTTDIEVQLEARVQEIEERLKRTTESFENLESRVDSVAKGLHEVEDVSSKHLSSMDETYTEIMNRASVEAISLQNLFADISQDMYRRAREATTSFETALEAVTQRATDQTEVIMTTLNAAAVSSAVLKYDMDQIQVRAQEASQYQEKIEANMHHLKIYVDAMSSRYNEHSERLKQAQVRADKILVTLDSASDAAASFHNAFASGFAFSGWLPYIYCPLVSLVMGSYGLPPSPTRNFALIGLGETVAFVITNISNQVDFLITSLGLTRAADDEPCMTSFDDTPTTAAHISDSI